MKTLKSIKRTLLTAPEVKAEYDALGPGVPRLFPGGIL